MKQVIHKLIEESKNDELKEKLRDIKGENKDLL